LQDTQKKIAVVVAAAAVVVVVALDTPPMDKYIGFKEVM
jgi:hypothetical protein